MVLQFFKQKIASIFSSKKIIVLMYHRVANTAGDPWQLTVNPDNFEGQLAMLKQNFNII